MPRPLSELRLPKNKKLTIEQAFAVVLRERRKALGLSQADLEDEGMDQSYISKLELGKRQVGIRGIVILAKKLGISPWELLKDVTSRVDSI